MNALVFASLLSLLAATAWADGREEFPNRARFLPHHQFEPLPGKVIGVLASETRALCLAEGRHGVPDALGFSVDGGSYRWVYVRATEKAQMEALDVLVGPAGADIRRFERLNVATLKTAQGFGLTRPFHLVEVEVNEGLGAPSEDHIVALKMRVVDGTTAFPLVVADVVAEARRDYQTFLEGQQKSVEAALEGARVKALGAGKPTGPREREERLLVSWDRKTEHLVVRLFTRQTDGAYQTSTGVSPRPGDPPGQGTRYGKQFGVELGMSYEANRQGQIVRRQVLSVAGFQKELPPPPTAPSRK